MFMNRRCSSLLLFRTAENYLLIEAAYRQIALVFIEIKPFQRNVIKQ